MRSLTCWWIQRGIYQPFFSRKPSNMFKESEDKWFHPSTISVHQEKKKGSLSLPVYHIHTYKQFRVQLTSLVCVWTVKESCSKCRKHTQMYRKAMTKSHSTTMQHTVELVETRVRYTGSESGEARKIQRQRKLQEGCHVRANKARTLKAYRVKAPRVYADSWVTGHRWS